MTAIPSAPGDAELVARIAAGDEAALGTAWGSETPIRSCGEAVVLVDEPIEQVAATDIARVDRDRLPGR
jgi:hypothetical protein